MIHVLLVDDHELVRTGIRHLLAGHQDIVVQAEVDSGEAALEAVRAARPNVVLMDISMPGIGGLEATRRLVAAYPGIKIIALTGHTCEPFPSQLLKAGAVGYLTKDCSPDEMVKAIRQVIRGRTYISHAVAQDMAASLLPGNKASPLQQLSRRELQVMMLLVEGNKPSAIAEQLHLSPKTISTYRYRLQEKLGVYSDAELTRLAMHYGLLEGS